MVERLVVPWPFSTKVPKVCPLFALKKHFFCKVFLGGQKNHGRENWAIQKGDPFWGLREGGKPDLAAKEAKKPN